MSFGSLVCSKVSSIINTFGIPSGGARQGIAISLMLRDRGLVCAVLMKEQCSVVEAPLPQHKCLRPLPHLWRGHSETNLLVRY